MSNTIITLRSYTDGLPTDLTSISLQDETGTYGLRRIDTQAVVVASGTALTRSALGVYTHTLTDPAADLDYEYVLRIVTGGNTYYYPRTTTDASVVNLVYTIPTTSHYTSQAECSRIMGQFAIDLALEDWDAENTQDIWDDILQEVDEIVDLHIAHKYPVNSFTNTYLRRRATKIACYKVSGRRGNPNSFVREYTEAMEALEDIRANRYFVPGLIPSANHGPVVRNYMMQPGPYPQRVEIFKSTGDSYAGIKFAYQPYMFNV